jgi:hypothetical protein
MQNVRRTGTTWWEWVTVPALVGALVWNVASALMICPHYLPCFNRHIGAPKKGYLYPMDSNLDWRQDKRLLEQCLAASSEPILVESGYQPTVGRVAVSANTLRGICGDKRERYSWLRKCEPVYFVGSSWLILQVSGKIRQEVDT